MQCHNQAEQGVERQIATFHMRELVPQDEPRFMGREGLLKIRRE